MLHNIKKSSFLVLLGVMAVFCFTLNAVQANAQTLSRTLGSGSVGNDVKILQQWLNSDPDTIIASSGAGSPGFETTKFGPATVRMVQKFQLKYGVLKKGASGYGMVGPKTIKKLQEVFGGAAVVTPAPSANTSAGVAAAVKPKPKGKITVITGALTGIAPDKSVFNVKIGKRRYDYSILLDGDTSFIGKDGTTTNIDDFGFGDQVQVRGVITKAYTLNAVQVRDLTAWKIPVKQTTMTIKDISIDSNELVATDSKQDWHIKIQSQTVVMNSDRTSIKITDLAIGDIVYVAGVWNQHTGVIFGSVIQKK